MRYYVLTDSLEFLKYSMNTEKIIYISDAKHDTEFEKREFELRNKKNLMPGSIIISIMEKSLSEFSIQNKKKLFSF